MIEKLLLEQGLPLVLISILAVIILVFLFGTFNTIVYFRILLRPEKEKFLKNKLVSGWPIPPHLSPIIPLSILIVLLPIQILWGVATFQNSGGIAVSILLMLNILFALFINIDKIKAIHFATLYPNGRIAFSDAVRAFLNVNLQHHLAYRIRYSLQFLGMNIFWDAESIFEKYSTFLRRTFAYMRWVLDKVIVIIAIIVVGYFAFSSYSGGNMLGAAGMLAI
ncbi:MAG: hypothetical protein FJY86_02005, partial [Candidatus Diapherotrites archaeon]|nr:hypothetical protein [Candidatus Diapherotrites archaeon]